MNDSGKKMSNPLFNAAVTGGTFEEFSQHALLLPAKEKTPPPTINLTTDDILNRAPSQPCSSFLEPVSDLNVSQPQLFEPSGNSEIFTEQVDLQPAVPTETTNFSSVFSSLSNILTGKNDSQQEEFVAPPPAGLQELLLPPQQDSVPSIPLFNPNDSCLAAPKTSVQGPVNNFRKGGLKRPTYAQPPGLTGPIKTQIPPPFPQPSFAQEVNTFVPSSNPQPYQSFYPHPSVPQIPSSSPFEVSFGNQSPVMASIPASEALEASRPSPATTSNNYMSNGNNSFVNTSPGTHNQVYRSVYHHWFYKKKIEGKTIWQPFSMKDSLELENAFTSNDLDPDKVIPTDGGRFDVNILRRERVPVYWKGGPSEVRRCSWFHKSSADRRIEPYEENIATKLEEEFKIAFETNQWHRNIELASGETVVFHAPDVLVVIPPNQNSDVWANSQNQSKPRKVIRGMGEFDIEDGEPGRVDHLLFMVHGIGSVCDLKFRSVEEVVDEFRSIALQLVTSHYRSSCESGLANRIEVLPISWHDQLHSEDTGIDQKLKSITLESIPRLRDFTNDTLLDILFYSSPIYCQTIISTVGNELNRIHELFKKRNPDFTGGVSLGGHSLGSLILFDLLGHQHPQQDEEEDQGEESDLFPTDPTKPKPSQRKMSRRISYMMSSIGTGQAQLHYPQLVFQPKAFFALGSPIGMFVTVRGLDKLGDQFALPTCPAFFNIFHPYDPVAYRVEALVNPDLASLKPVLIPHHKGRKRMHLELKETMAKVGADLKQRVIDSMKSTWNSFYQLAMFHKAEPPSLEEEVDKAFQQQLREEATIEEEVVETTDLCLGILNKGRRIDYVLQEAPFEFFNDYIFAVTSHVCYWDSEDTMLLMLKEIYSSMNIQPDSQIPQQTMTIERPPSSSKFSAGSDAPTGMDPTFPLQTSVNLGPPPTSGFIKKT